MLSFLVFVLFIIGIYFIVIYVSKIQCPPARVEYRFLPRTFEEQQNDPALVSRTFSDMFLGEAPSEKYESGGKFRGMTSDNFNRLNAYSYKV